MNGLIQKNDLKSRMWSESLQEYGIKLIPLKGSPIKWAYYFILFKSKMKVDFIVFRYLNDYPNVFRTLIRFSSELLTLLMAKLTNTDVYWICHNVDKETDDNYPRISKIRRRLIAKHSKTIFVLDYLLVEEARVQLGHQNVKNISFGDNENIQLDEDVMEEINAFINEGKPNTIFGLTVGTINYKTVHFMEIPRLINESINLGIDLRMIVCGPVGTYLKKNNISLFNFLKDSNKVLFIDKYVNIDESKLERVSFVFKSNLDKSVPQSYYTSVTSKKPILSMGGTFSAEMVKYYNIGSVLYPDYSNLQTALNDLSKSSFEFDQFLTSHSWQFSAQVMSKEILGDEE